MSRGRLFVQQNGAVVVSPQHIIYTDARTAEYSAVSARQKGGGGGNLEMGML